MADFIDSEAESDNSDNEELDPHERKKLKRLRAVSDSEEDDEDDEDRIREEIKDLIDDNPIDEDGSDDAEDSDGSGAKKKRKKSDDEDELDDRLSEDDYALIEENLGVTIQRQKRFKRLRRIQNEDSDPEQEADEGMERDVIANQLFDGDDDEESSRRSVSGHQRHGQRDNDHFDEEGEEEEESDADDFIVDDDGRPITEKKKKNRRIFNDAHLQEGQDIFGVEFDYEEFDKYDEDEYEDESEAEDEYEEDGAIETVEKEKRQKKARKKKMAKKSIFEIYEPSELKRGHFTDLDNEIRKTDIPERMQLREVPLTVVPDGSTELIEEAEWIYKHAFAKTSISTQEDVEPMPLDDEDDQNNNNTNNNPVENWDDDDDFVAPPPVKVKTRDPIGKIKQALDFMRNQQLEVPFIAFYRKEYVQPELNINDLWKVYQYDGKWCQLQSRKRSLLKLFEKMRNFQNDKIMNNPDNDIPDDVRVIHDEDIERLQSVQSAEELKDVHTHFLLHYSHDIPAMQEAWRIKEREKRRFERRQERLRMQENAEEGVEVPEEISDEEDGEDQFETIKYARDSGPYPMCRKAGILGLAKRFGLKPEQFAENLRDCYQRHDVDQESTEPLELAKEYATKKFENVEDVMYAAKFVVARQISREPLLRKSVREIYYQRATVTVAPTKKGQKEIDENHTCYSMKYLKDKPVADFVGDQFLRLCMAEEDKLITITISERIHGNNSTNSTYLEEMQALYQRDEFSKNVQEWNAIRASCVEEALNKMVIPDIRKELKSILLMEAKESVKRACCRKLHNWIKIAPPNVNFSSDDTYDWDTTKGLRIMGIAYEDDLSQAAFGVLIAPDADVTDYIRLPHILKRKNGYRSSESKMKNTDLDLLKNFIRAKKPHIIVIGGESKQALMVKDDVSGILKELIMDEQFAEVHVEILDNELAKIYSNSKKGVADFREYPVVLRQAVSLARRIQDPLIEFSQLCTADEEILCLRYHTLQEQLEKEELLEALYIEFINRTNEVGVDVNLAVQNALTVNLVQFICGLGPRKGQALLKILKQTNQRLENRTQLVTICHMGPKVFINCSGFIKIDTNSLGDSTEAYVEVLDGSRVHPETYEWARKMAVDALEYGDEDQNPAGALEEILAAPERLKDLDLDAFADELERQGFGHKKKTLYDIRAELNERYKDLRQPYRSYNSEELFEVLSKETHDSLYVGKLIVPTVVAITHRKPQGEQLDNANPVRDDQTGLWQCPFCLNNEFPQLSEVWNHFDAGECPGQATGIRLQVYGSLSGFIHIKNLSDKHVANPEERVRVGQTIHARIMKIDIDRFSVDCTSKTSDLIDKSHEWRPSKDKYYDQDTEDNDTRKEDETKKNQNRQHYTKRIIIHPAFHNKSYQEAVKIMESMDQGEVVVRPSSKGTDHLTVTWKVADGIYQHIDVREEGKENVFSLGQSLWIGNEEFEALDEIIARHINPMAAYARDLLTYKYYRNTAGGMKDKMEELLKEEKKKNASKIHYFVSAAKNYPGKFLLSYLPRLKCRHEYVTVTPDGFRFRQQIFESLNSLLKWFKEHFKDPVPITPVQTPRGMTSVSSIGMTSGGGGGGGNTGGASVSSRNSFSTPTLSSSISSDAIHKVAQNMPSHMLNSLSQAATSGQTPHHQYPHTPSGYGNQTSYINTPYTPSGQTPFMTPYHTPHQTPHHTPGQTPHHQTPRYGSGSSSGGHTPQQSGHHNTNNNNSSGSNGGQFLHPGSVRSSSHAQQQHHHQQQQQQYHQQSHHQSNYNLSQTSPSYQQQQQQQQQHHNYQRSPYNAPGSSPHSRGGGGGGQYATIQQEKMDWQKAAEAWATRPRRNDGSGSVSGTPRSDSGRMTPKGNSNRSERYDEYSKQTPTYDDKRPSSRSGRPEYNQRQSHHHSQHQQQQQPAHQQQQSSSNHHHPLPTKSPRSTRSTPRTNTSPHSMTPGDATPLYDEN